MSYRSQAESLISKTSLRVTTKRVEVLSFLLQQSSSLSHHEIKSKLGGIDYVTLYRVLDRLVEFGLMHKVIGNDQIWRFGAGGGYRAHRHAHFQCSKCAKITCFNEMKLPEKISLPAGFKKQEVDFLIKGICPQCG